MSQHCRANPCCGDRPCSGIPLPQDASGFPSYNKNNYILGITEIKSDYNWNDIKGQLERYGGEPDGRLLEVLDTVTDINDDMQHGRSISEKVDRLKIELDNLVVTYKP